jgi:uracil DNA glycosylase
MDPYCRRYRDGKLQATGIPMDCSNSPDGKLQPSLTKFYDTMSKELGHKVQYSPSLKYLLEQGCMLLNSDLTVKLNKTQSHEGLWRPFMKYFFEEILTSYPGMIYVLAGKASQALERYINPLGNYIFKVEHPAAEEEIGTLKEYLPKLIISF